MYLVDAEIRVQLPALQISTWHEQHPFDPTVQVRSCSIDLRVDNKIWRGGKRGTIDMRTSVKERLRPRRGWISHEVSDNGVIVVKPGKLVFARVYERFTMPTNFAGKIEGRSSFARLGLSVHAASDFINPGWSGHMPLQLYNAGPHTIRIPPFTPICQLMLIPLSKAPDRPYGHRDLGSKYLGDEGGPSYWWRDAGIKQLQKRLKARSLPLGLEDKLAKLTAGRDLEIIDRFDRYIERRRVGQMHDEQAILDDFARTERNRKAARSVVTWGSGICATALLGVLIRSIVLGGFSFARLPSWALIACFLAAAGVNVWLPIFRPRTGYLLPEDLERAHAQLQDPEQVEDPTARSEESASREPRRTP